MLHIEAKLFDELFQISKALFSEGLHSINLLLLQVKDIVWIVNLSYAHSRMSITDLHKIQDHSGNSLFKVSRQDSSS